MALGPGKYDSICTTARKSAKAEGVMLVIFGGEFGNGFSVQASIELTARLPEVLRNLARDIEDSFPRG